MEEIHTILAYPTSPKIVQNKESFPFSVDSTILSFFAEIKSKTGRIIDLGSGTGIIPLTLSLMTKLPIDAVEIQSNLCDLLNKSISLNHLENQITVLNEDIKDIHKKIGHSKYGLILSNPPYFKVNKESLINKFESKSISRHEVLITMEDIIKEASILLKDGGSFTMVQSTDRLLETIELLSKYRLYPKRLRFVYSKKNQDSYIFLLDASKNVSKDGLKIYEPLYIYDESGEYSKEILSYYHFKEENEENK